EAGTRFLDVHHYPVYAESGDVIGGATREVDVTERLRLTRALEEREAFLECIFGGTDTAICALDVGDGGHGRVADVNSRFEHLMRVRAEEVRGLDLQPFLSNLPADAAGPFRAHVRRCLETRTSLTFELP